MTILITGGAGYIGSHTALSLKRQGYDFVVYDNLSSGHRESIRNYPFVQGDISDRPLLENTIKSYGVTDVIHFAASSIVGESMQNPQKYYQNNVAGTLSLLDTLLACKVKKIVFSSTAAVYGEPDLAPITENSSKKPTNVYGRTKLMIENILADYDLAYSLKYVSLRYFNACGADDGGLIGEDHRPETHLIPLILQTALGLRKRISIYGDDYPTNDGTCIRDYIHVNDLAHAHVLALNYLRNDNKSDVFNLGNGNGFSVKEIIRAAEKVVGSSIPQDIGPRRSGDPAVLVADAQKAKKKLGWKPEYTDLEGIIKTACQW
ncbi:MAG: UDP-glucose 4-epimerase GalE, partial [Peptococcaceae bacterium]|nr:UDP-glucose 4-epimerase GalE [Peptococcaceae bacterium]